MTQQENIHTQKQRGNAKNTGNTKVEPDETYGLISVLYHALQGAETCAQYISDAEKANARDLVSFFEEYQQQQQLLAARAKQLLANQLEDELEDESEEYEEEEGEDEED